MDFRKTNVVEKGAASLINTVFVFILAVPLYFIIPDKNQWIISIVVLFFLYNLYFYIFFQNRCLGMRVIETHWGENYSFFQEIWFILLYTLSFATIFIWIWFPFDVFIINMILQIIWIQLTGYTIHGYLSGMHTIRYVKGTKIKKPLFRFTGYNILSTITFFIDLFIVWFLTEKIGVHYLFSVCIGFATATLLNYASGRKIIFKETKQKALKGYFISLLVAISTLIVVLSVTWALVNFAYLNYLLARIIAAIIAGIWGYILDNRYTFRIPVFT